MPQLVTHCWIHWAVRILTGEDLQHALQLICAIINLCNRKSAQFKESNRADLLCNSAVDILGHITGHEID